jgi:hypothetical protein
MIKYHKIQTVYKRDPETNFKTLLEGEWSLEEFDFLKNNIWMFTEKIDGTNIRVQWGTHHYPVFQGKTDNAQIPATLLACLPEYFHPEIMRDAFGEDKQVCLYGEGFGNRIQKAGKLYLPKSVDFILFDVNIDGYWLNRENVENIAKKFGLKVVPIIGYGTLLDGIELTRMGIPSQISEEPQIAEGLVMRLKMELFNRRGQRMITKIKYKDFRHYGGK